MPPLDQTESVCVQVCVCVCVLECASLECPTVPQSQGYGTRHMGKAPYISQQPAT
jgi:hypothetical protein